MELNDAHIIIRFLECISNYTQTTLDNVLHTMCREPETTHLCLVYACSSDHLNVAQSHLPLFVSSLTPEDWACNSHGDDESPVAENVFKMCKIAVDSVLVQWPCSTCRGVVVYITPSEDGAPVSERTVHIYMIEPNTQDTDVIDR